MAPYESDAWLFSEVEIKVFVVCHLIVEALHVDYIVENFKFTGIYDYYDGLVIHMSQA